MLIVSAKSATGAAVLAIRVTEENIEAAAEWAGGNVLVTKLRGRLEAVTFRAIEIPIRNGHKLVQIGDWLVKFSETDPYPYVYTNYQFQNQFTYQ